MYEHTCMNRHKLETDACRPKEYVSTEIQPCAFENEPTNTFGNILLNPEISSKRLHFQSFT